MNSGIESLGRVRAQGIALLFITFLVGLIAGFAAERVHSARSTTEPPPARIEPPFRPDHLPPMFRRLDLTPAQRDRIAEIMESRRPQTRDILDEMLPRLGAVMDSTHAEIRAVLTPEQAERWDDLLSRMHKRRQMMGPRRPGAGRRPDGMGPPANPEPGR